MQQMSIPKLYRAFNLAVCLSVCQTSAKYLFIIVHLYWLEMWWPVSENLFMIQNLFI